MENIQSNINIPNITSNNQSSFVSKLPNMPSISSIKNPLEKSPGEKVMDTFSLNTKPTLSINQQNTSSIFGWGFRFLLLIVILLLLFVNSWTYLEKGTDLFSSTLRKGFVKTSTSILNTIEDSFENAVKGTRFSTGIIGDSVKSSINLVRAMITTKLNKNEKATMKVPEKTTTSNLNKEINKKHGKNDIPQPHDTEDNIQSSKKKYCYIGHATPHNACVEINDTGKCLSGKVFKSQKECENYEPVAPMNH